MQLTETQIEAIRTLHKMGIRPPSAAISARRAAHLDVVSHAEQTFYTPDTGKLIRLEEFQKIFLRICAGDHGYPNLLPFYSTVYMTSTKKTGKTAISGCYAKWRTESPVYNDEILFFANDETQSRGRAYAAIEMALRMNPHFDPQKRILYDDEGNPVWRIIEDYLEHVPTMTKVRAVNVDYRGEAGSNPTLTVWTEVWGYDTDKQEKLYDEMTPVLTRKRSQRYLEGYAGYTGKSKIQEKVERLLTDRESGGRQLTRDDIPDWPFSEEYEGGPELPLYVNDTAGLFAFIDRGRRARERMPWNVGPEAAQYYREQELTLPPEQWERLHNNMWVSPTDAFIPIEWWNQCAENVPNLLPYREPVTILNIPVEDANDMHLWPSGEVTTRLRAYCDPRNWKVVNQATPIVLGVDASVVGDCTGVVAVSRHPERHLDLRLTHAYMWTPPHSGKMDYDITPDIQGSYPLKFRLIDMICRYNVVEIAYDNWQLHHLMNELRNMGIVWPKEFSQSKGRDVADKQLYDLIRSRRLVFNEANDNITHQHVRRHLTNAGRQVKPKEDTKLHIIKISDEGKIDLVICMSMATAECLRLDL